VHAHQDSRVGSASGAQSWERRRTEARFARTRFR
jgi:hypothetical protein